MQRPRRTSEFQDESGIGKTRQTRGRPSSLDRASSSSAMRQPLRGRTPILTPQKNTLIKGDPRVLFTAEKRGGANDKKGIEEKAQKIMEYLSTQVGAIPAVGADFFARNGGLRAMTTKQFVGIINHFLPYICGNRYNVNANNYIDDIVSIAQKVHYPHQLNKSWLKTPITQHSFGHVVVFLDYLLEFVPSANNGASWSFPMQDIVESQSDDQQQIMPDSEFQRLLLLHAEEGFQLWDMQKMDQFEALQQRTSDILIQKRCGIEGCIALDVEIKRLAELLTDIESQRPQISNAEREHHQQLKDELERVLQQTQATREELSYKEEQSTQLLGRRQTCIDQLKKLEADIVTAEASINNQTCSAEQRDSLVEEVEQLKHRLQCKIRTVNELQDRNHHQQVLLSRAKKQLTTRVEKFNGYLSEIAYSLKRYILGNNLNLDQLQLSHNVDGNDLNRLADTLQRLHKHVLKSVQDDNVLSQQLEQQNAKMSRRITNILEPKINSLQTKIAAAHTARQQGEEYVKTIKKRRADELCDLVEKLNSAHLELASLKESIEAKQSEHKKREEQNERIMSQAEKQHLSRTQKRIEDLNNFESAWIATNLELDKLEEMAKAFE